MDFFNFNPRTDFHELNLDYVVQEVIKLEMAVEWLKTQVELPEQKWEELEAKIDEINAEIETIKNGDYLEPLVPDIINAVDDALPELISRVMRFFIFGLTKDGYFSAMYPDNFDNITFDTIADPDSELYGHLILQF